MQTFPTLTREDYLGRRLDVLGAPRRRRLLQRLSDTERAALDLSSMAAASPLPRVLVDYEACDDTQLATLAEIRSRVSSYREHSQAHLWVDYGVLFALEVRDWMRRDKRLDDWPCDAFYRGHFRGLGDASDEAPRWLHAMRHELGRVLREAASLEPHEDPERALEAAYADFLGEVAQAARAVLAEPAAA